MNIKESLYQIEKEIKKTSILQIIPFFVGLIIILLLSIIIFNIIQEEFFVTFQMTYYITCCILLISTFICYVVGAKIEDGALKFLWGLTGLLFAVVALIFLIMFGIDTISTLSGVLK